MSKTKTSELIKGKVNQFGELHLDAEMTVLLIKLVECDEKIAEAAKLLVTDLKGSIKSIDTVGGAE